MKQPDEQEQEDRVLNAPSDARWRRRRRELETWIARPKERRRAKQTAPLGREQVDIELLEALTLLNRLGVTTEYSCAGVSVLDEPEEHSLYAYVTFPASERADLFVRLAIRRMRHRLLAVYESARDGYDLSSFLIGQNRSFCMLLAQCARDLERALGEAQAAPEVGR